MRLRLSLAAFLLASTVLVACGGDSGGGGGATATEGDEFCTLAKAADSSNDQASTALDTGDADKIKTELTRAAADGARAAKAAPDDIRATVDKVVDGQNQIIAALERNDWDILKAFSDKEFATLIEDTSFATAGDKLETYLSDKCGIAPETADTEAATETMPADAASGDAIDQFLRLYEVGSGTQLTDEQRSCLKEAVGDKLTTDDLTAIVQSGEPSGELALVLGTAFLTCNVVTG
jgi:hypothetical protein